MPEHSSDQLPDNARCREAALTVLFVVRAHHGHDTAGTNARRTAERYASRQCALSGWSMKYNLFVVRAHHGQDTEGNYWRRTGDHNGPENARCRDAAPPAAQSEHDRPWRDGRKVMTPHTRARCMQGCLRSTIRFSVEPSPRGRCCITMSQGSLGSRREVIPKLGIRQTRVCL